MDPRMPPRQRLYCILKAHYLPDTLLPVGDSSFTWAPPDTYDFQRLSPKDNISFGKELKLEYHYVVEEAAQSMPILTCRPVVKAEQLRRQMISLSKCAASADVSPRTETHTLPSRLQTYVFDAVNSALGQLLPSLPGDLSWQLDRTRGDFRLLWRHNDAKGAQSHAVIAIIRAMNLPSDVMRDLRLGAHLDYFCVDSEGRTASSERTKQKHPDLACRIVDELRSNAFQEGALFTGLTDGEWWLIAEVRRAPQHRSGGKDLAFSHSFDSSFEVGCLPYASTVLGRLLAVSVLGLRRVGVRIEDCHAGIDEGDDPASGETPLLPPPVVEGKPCLAVPTPTSPDHCSTFSPNTSLRAKLMGNSEPTLFQPFVSAESGGNDNPIISLGKKRSHGAIWTAFDCHLLPMEVNNTDLTPPRIEGLIAKYHRPAAEEDRAKVRASVQNEYDIVTGPLRPLQGNVVPRLYGLWMTEEGEYLCLMEDAGTQLSTEEQDDYIVLAKVRRIFERIFEAGVHHNDLEWRHVLRRGDSIKIIDFDRAFMRLDETAEDWKNRTDTAVDLLFSIWSR